MKILAWIFFVSLEVLLVDFAASSCQPLNTTLFNGCVQAGYHVSNFTSSGKEVELSHLITNMQRKFKNCSSLLSLMTCSLHLPKCPTAQLPCKDACKKFLSDCGDISSENDGLKTLFRGICELLPSTKCLSEPTTGAHDSGK